MSPVSRLPMTRPFCCCSVTQLCPTLCDLMDCSTPGLPAPHHLPEFAQVHVHCMSDAIQTSHPLMPSSPSDLKSFTASWTFPMSQLFASDDQKPGVFSFSFSISPSDKYSRLSSFKIDWIDLLSVQETIRSLLWHHSSKASILQHSAFFLAHNCA